MKRNNNLSIYFIWFARSKCPSDRLLDANRFSSVLEKRQYNLEKMLYVIKLDHNNTNDDGVWRHLLTIKLWADWKKYN